jgi:hypothetical protein
LGLAASAALLVAAPAAGKAWVEATLTTNIPLDASPGTHLDVGWTLGFDKAGMRRPFEARGIFVRIASASGQGATIGFASGDRGEYEARVVVPRGGIGDVQIGFVGWRTDGTGTRRGYVMFPITNDPLPGPLRVSPPSGRSAAWIYAVGAAALGMLATIALEVRRRTVRAASAASGASL